MEDDDIESILFMCREVMVYKVPPRQSNAGYRATEWGDLGAFLWKGRMRIIERGSGCSIRLEDPQTGEVFAQAPYDVTGMAVEAVLDSSRYFVLRAEDQGRKAYIGIGFSERAESFDFNVALQDYTKRQKALLNPETTEETASPHLPAGPKKDYSLKEGQTFSINIPGKSSTTSSGSASQSSGLGASAGFPLLPPPPKAPEIGCNSVSAIAKSKRRGVGTQTIDPVNKPPQVHTGYLTISRHLARIFLPFLGVTSSFSMAQNPKWEEYIDRIHYSDRYSDDHYEYRHVILPKPLLKMIPKNYFEPDDSGVLRILDESEWRGIGITQSLGWEHYEVHAPEPHVLLFRRAKAPAAQPARATAATASKPAAKARK